MKKRIKFVQYRRKREGRTNYRKRLKMLISGTSRIVIRKSNKHITIQVVDYEANGDKVIVTAKSSELKKYGWNHACGNIPAAYLTGMLAGHKAVKKKAKKAIVDLGLQIPAKGSKIYAAVKGAIDAGLEINCSEEALPKEDRIKGKHIDAYKQSGVEKDFETVKNNIGK
ncbi:TPA: 50S ribosomal protein L18 [Candidatus Woesearchaeota archaeon]|nr:50S ribosomal protein L18 [Candidatus Woesearchaeota archaeon]HIJ01121.1 50S ribosomal protein L18 [Candidatus Woesearchaeota archaeon]